MRATNKNGHADVSEKIKNGTKKEFSKNSFFLQLRTHISK